MPTTTVNEQKYGLINEALDRDNNLLTGHGTAGSKLLYLKQGFEQSSP